MNRVRQVEHHLRERLPTVHVERRGEVGIIWLARQARYGAMSCGLHRDVRRDILLSLQGLQKDDGCTGILIASDRRNVFSTGINRRDFDDGVFDGFDAAGRVVPSVATLCSAISSSPKLVVVLLGGLCQSWGLELALAAHYRIGMANCRLSFPEVLLGTVPCGGTLPRLIAKIGVPETVSMVVYGKVMHAQRAYELQVLDWVLTPPPQLDTTATAAAASIMSQAVEMVLKWNSNGGVAKWAASQPAPMLISTLFHRSQLAWERHKLLTIVPYRMKAPYLAADAVGLALAHGLNPSAAQREEQKNQFLQCVHGLEGVGAQHVMRATTNIWYHLDQTPPPTQIPRLLSGGAPFPHVVIIGGGAVGASLVLHILRYVPQVSVVEANEVRRRNLMSYLEVCIQERYALTEGRDAIRDFLLSRLRVVGGAQSPLNSSVFRTASLVIECTSEGNADVKRNNIARIDRLCPPNCLFVVCSGAPDLHAIATATSRPSKVMALILYSPVDVVPMVELMTTDETCGLALHQVLCFLGDVHKNVVVTKAVKGKLRGAVSTRLLLSAMFQAYAMLEDGCFPFDIDSILQRTLHFRFGIFALADQLGLDVLSAFRVTMRESQRQRQQDDPSYNFTSREVFDVEESLVRHGKLGKKAGEGWYKYSPLGSLDPVSFDHDDNASGKATIDDELSNFTIQKLKSSHNRDVEMCALRWSKHKHIKRRDMSRKEITERILLAMLQEAAMMIEEGQVSSSADIDVISVLLLGFPVTKGGICYYADHLFPGGLKKIVYEMRIYNEAFGNHVFPPPCAALLRMAAEERTFESSGAKQIP